MLPRQPLSDIVRQYTRHTLSRPLVESKHSSTSVSAADYISE